MEAETVRKLHGEPARSEPAAEPEQPIELPAEPAVDKAGTPVVVGRSRCPFCHAGVALETQEWVACEGCLARHHATCWRDNGACSSCGGTKQLVPSRAAPPRPATNRALWAAVLGLFATFAILAYWLVELDDRLKGLYHFQTATLQDRDAFEAKHAKAHDAFAAKEKAMQADVDVATAAGKVAHERADAERAELARRVRGVEVDLSRQASDESTRNALVDQRLRKLENPPEQNGERALIAARSAERDVAENLEHALAVYAQGKTSAEDLRIVATQATTRLLEAAKSYETAGKPEDAKRAQYAADFLTSWKDVAEGFRKAIEILEGKPK